MSTLVRRLVISGSALLVLAVGVGSAVQLERPLPALTFQADLARTAPVPGRAAQLPWPTEGQAAIYLSGFGWLGSTGGEIAVPIASVTKIMTALVILRADPLKVGMVGPEVTVSAADFALYQTELAQGDSVVRVEPGETLSELQLLEGLLLPSGDNLAVLLADWAAGSEPAFVQRMNQLASSLHLSHTHFTDSSGLAPGSVSCARDLVALANVAMRIQVFASIVAMPTVTLPTAGPVHNYNPLLGQDGVIGIKTGWTEEAMGCLVFAARDSVDGRAVQLIGAVLGQPGGPAAGLLAAAGEAKALLVAGEAALDEVHLPPAGPQVGRVTSAWGSEISVDVTRGIGLVGVGGSQMRLRLQLRQLRAPLRRGAVAGDLTATTPGGFSLHLLIEANGKLAAPSWWWRLTRSF
ncbi:MAG TPA: D-alanyl-D-alanine carboxypeptidase [Candidatus Dormibacteraeota bacterium]|nr:D-alanyl-D-alanine carboxypeptidase [Candidatus Dormibacteraeota bacterium]